MNWELYKHQIVFSENGRVSNWFSNMISSNIEIDGILFSSTENYYQSQKMLNEKDRRYIASLSSYQSKLECRKFPIRKDWEEVKVSIMKRGLIEKFKISKWNALLKDTENDPIIEWNNWNDKFWGVSIFDYKGKNQLGNLLMEIRSEFFPKFSNFKGISTPLF